MKLTYGSVIALALLAVTSPLFAQARAYSNADLGRPLSSDRGRPEHALATWLDHTGGIVPSYGEARQPEALWIVGPVSDWNPTLSPTLPLSPADFNHCYGCEFVHQHGFRSGKLHLGNAVSTWRGRDPVRIQPPSDYKSRSPRPDASVTMHAVGSRR